MRADAMWFCAGVALALMGGTRVAAADTGFDGQIPNGTCDYCHAPVGQPRLNDFGKQFCPELLPAPDDDQCAVEVDVGGVFTVWASVRMNDPDADGKSSQLEIGDPCGIWAPEQNATRTTELSNPGITDQVTPVNDGDFDCSNASPSTGAGEAERHPEFPQGFCAVGRGAGAGGSTWSLVALAAGAAALLVGRRRAR